MAENTEFSAKLKEIIEQNKPLPAEDNAFMKELAESTTALDSLDESSLKNLQASVENLAANSPYRTVLSERISDKLNKLQTTAEPTDTRDTSESSSPEASAGENKTAESEQSTADKPKTFTDFIKQPSYSVAARHKELSEKGDSATPEELEEKEYLEAMAKEALKLSSPETVSIDNAVALKDYCEIASNSPDLTNEEKEKLAKLEPQIEKALAEFDNLNDISLFDNFNPDEMDKNEEAWLQKSKELFSDIINEDNKETFDLLSHLAAQKLKHQAPGENAQKVIGQEIEDLKAQFDENVRNEIINQGATNKFKAETGLSDEEIAALKISGDKGLLDNDEEKKKYEALVKIREDYLKKYADADINTVATVIAAEETALKDPEKAKKLAAIQNKIINKQPLTDEDNQIYDEFKKLVQQKVNIAVEATQVTYAREIDALASRTARVTGAKDVTNKTKSVLKEFADKHPKLYTAGKCIALGGSKAVLGMIIGQVAGVNGLAAYSAYNTFNACKKAYKEFQAETGEKGFKNFIKYLKKEENADKRINLIGSIARTSITMTLATVGNVTGLSYIPGFKTAANMAVNMATNTAKFFHSGKAFLKDKSSKNKKKLLVAGAALAVTGAAAAVTYFLPDETKEKIGDWVKGLFKGKDDAPAPETPNEPEVESQSSGSSSKPFNLEEAQQGIRDAAKLDPETERIINQKYEFHGHGHGGKILGQADNGNGNPDTTPTPTPTPTTPTPETIKAEEVSYSFDQRKGLFISNTKGVGIHHTDTAVKGTNQLFEGGTAKLPSQAEGEANTAYDERVIAAVNADISRNAELSDNYHAKFSIQKQDGSTIDVKQHASVKETNEETLTRVRRKIRTEDDTYTQKIDRHTDKETGQSYTTTKFRSHQVESNTVGDANGVKDDKILRAATIGNKKYEIIRDGDTGKKFIVESQRNENGVYERVSSAHTTMGDKKTLQSMIDKEMNSQNAGAAAAPQPVAQNTIPPDPKIKEISLAQLIAMDKGDHTA